MGAVDPNKSWVACEQDRLPVGGARVGRARVGGARVELGRARGGRVGLRQARQDKIEGGGRLMAWLGFWSGAPSCHHCSHSFWSDHCVPSSLGLTVSYSSSGRRG